MWLAKTRIGLHSAEPYGGPVTPQLQTFKLEASVSFFFFFNNEKIIKPQDFALSLWTAEKYSDDDTGRTVALREPSPWQQQRIEQHMFV